MLKNNKNLKIKTIKLLNLMLPKIEIKQNPLSQQQQLINKKAFTEKI